MRKNKKLILIASAAVLLLVMALAVVLLAVKKQSELKEAEAAARLEEQLRVAAKGSIIDENGVEHLRNSGIETFLLFGVDKFEDQLLEKYYSGNDLLADFILIFSIDHNAQTIRSLHINRDTYTPVRILNIRGEELGYQDMQICLAHTQGKADDSSCINLRHTLENLLDENIDHYMRITMDSVPIINDYCGGVTLKINGDFTAYNPQMTDGAIHTLKGADSLTYVRARKDVNDGTNLARMDRQKQYMNALYSKVRESAVGDKTFAFNLLMELTDYMKSDCSAEKLNQIFSDACAYDFQGIYSPEGTAELDENNWVVFTPDESSLKSLILWMWYK